VAHQSRSGFAATRNRTLSPQERRHDEREPGSTGANTTWPVVATPQDFRHGEGKAGNADAAAVRHSMLATQEVRHGEGKVGAVDAAAGRPSMSEELRCGKAKENSTGATAGRSRLISQDVSYDENIQSLSPGVSKQVLRPGVSEETVSSSASDQVLGSIASRQTLRSSASKQMLSPGASEKTVSSFPSEQMLGSSVSQKTRCPTAREQTPRPCVSVQKVSGGERGHKPASAVLHSQDSTSQTTVLRKDAAAGSVETSTVSSSGSVQGGASGDVRYEGESGGTARIAAGHGAGELMGAQEVVAGAEPEVLSPERYEQLIRRRRFSQGQSQLQEQRERQRWAGRAVSASTVARPQPSRVAASAAPRRRVTVAEVARGASPPMPVGVGGGLGRWLLRWQARQRLQDTVRASRRPLLGALLTVFPFLRTWGGFL
jgi:hypothetical protein